MAGTDYTAVEMGFSNIYFDHFKLWRGRTITPHMKQQIILAFVDERLGRYGMEQELPMFNP